MTDPATSERPPPDAGSAQRTVLDRREQAPAERTLVDILHETARRFPDASAIEDGSGGLSYRELVVRVEAAAARLRTAGVGRGDRIGIRMTSGASELYLSILAVLAAGAAYVPVDVDDPQERADLVFREAEVLGVILGSGTYRSAGATDIELFVDAPHGASTASLRIGAIAHPQSPRASDDAWIIFTSGSTGTPKGVAVSHRSAAAFVDAESTLFLPGEPLGPADRVLAGLSVAFDASCEEMWLAWRSGACLVPAPRSLVRSGADLGPWLLGRGITAVSTVPTLAGLWPADTIENVRLLIFGGEAFPRELATRLVADGREVWNTYGPTEATVVACAALADSSGPMRIGLPLDGWALAVVDADARPVAEGELGELIIGGAGLARYLDPEKDAEKYAPMPSLGWDRAYRSGDMVRFEEAGLIFHGRVDDQVKVGGRRIELGEIEAALQELPGVSAAAVTVRETSAGVSILVGYLAAPADFDTRAARSRLAERLPAPLIPVLAVLDELPSRTSGKVDKAALPWPIEQTEIPDASALGEDTAWLAVHWQAVLGVPVADEDADFFDLGGGSLAAAQLVTLIRLTSPEFTVADIYRHPRLGAMARAVHDTVIPSDDLGFSTAAPTSRTTQWVQTIAGVPLFILTGARWLLYALTASTILRTAGGLDYLPAVGWWWLGLGIVILATPFGRMAIAALSARVLLAGLRPGDYRRGGGVHLRLWLTEQVTAQIDPIGMAGAPWVTYYARALGARIGRDVDLHTMPPVTGMLQIGPGVAIEPEVDLSGYWIDGETVRIGAIRIGANATIGARSTLAPGTKIGQGAEIAPGSAVFGRVRAGQRWEGSPAVRAGAASKDWPDERPVPLRRYLALYALSSIGLALLPVVGFATGALVIAFGMRGTTDLGTAGLAAAAWLVPAVVATGIVIAGAVVVLVRALSAGLREGTHPARGRQAWQAWSIERLLDSARTLLFPLYASLFTPVWLRLLGAKVGRNVEASTVLLLPSMATIEDDAFLADDTMVASYALRGGWLRIARAHIGKRAFLGNSGMAAGGHRVPRDGLVAVLSVAPAKSKAGSSWLGSPAVRLRRVVADFDESRTFRPPARLRTARVLWELCRFIPVVITCGLGVAVSFALLALTVAVGPLWALLLSGIVMLLTGAVAAGVSTAAKWAIVGPIRVGEQPLWSSFVWRTEVADTFVEMLAAPWFARLASGTPALVVWLRSLGARIGSGVWCETYWLPEPDLVTLEDGSTVNRGCVVQTHLFHDRIMSMDTVTLEAGATLGPHSVILPAASIGANATVGPASLVMRGERVPVGSRWSGNPIGPWRAVTVRDYRAAAS